MRQSNTVIQLKVDFHGKAIPYPPRNHDISTNHGFVCLKGKPELAANIPEAKDNDSLRSALIALNSDDSAFFTVGCEKSFNKEDEHVTTKPYWAKGFLDVSFNAKRLVCDAVHYFTLFFKFNQYVAERQFAENVLYEWELVGANFKDGGCNGWTSCVWITTAFLDTEGKSKETWGRSLDFLVDFLMSIPVEESERIYY